MNKFFTLTICLIIPIISFCQTINGKVVRIADGDTVTILDSENNQIRIRLYGIDCPEDGQDFSNVAKMFTSDLCFSKNVTVDVKDINRYGRTVGIIWTPDSVYVNLELLKEGLAWHHKHFDQSKEFAHDEELSRTSKKGLRIQSNAVALWEYRRISK